MNNNTEFFQIDKANLTPSQLSAIELLMKANKHAWGDECKFLIWSPSKTALVYFVAQYKINNVLGKKIDRASSWLVGKRGKITQTIAPNREEPLYQNNY